jgi:hypothetical protein
MARNQSEFQFPDPREYNERVGYDVFDHHPDKDAFLAAGGRVRPWHPSRVPDRFVVSQPPATYDPRVDVTTVTEAMSLYLNLISEGWTVFVWDNEKNEGWSTQSFGPGFDENLREGKL